MIGVVEGALRAAEDDEAGISVRVFRNGIALKRAPHLAGDAGVAELPPDLAGRRADEILDDQDAHLNPGSDAP